MLQNATPFYLSHKTPTPIAARTSRETYFPTASALDEVWFEQMDDHQGSGHTIYQSGYDRQCERPREGAGICTIYYDPKEG